MFIPYLPIEGLHDFNLDWFLKKFHELREKWEETEAAWLALKAWVEEYFDNLDVQEEINNKIDEMYENGDLGRLIYSLINSSIFPAFVDSVNYMTNKAIPYVLIPDGYIYSWSGSQWVNTGVRYGAGGADVITSSRVIINADNVQSYNDFNDLSKNKVYAITTNAITQMTNKPPSSVNGTLLDYAYDGRDGVVGGRVQIYIDTNNQTYTRTQWANTWGRWSNNSYGTYTHGVDFDANNVDAPSVHYLYSLTSAQNLPAGFTQGTLITLSAVMPTDTSRQNVAVQNIISTAGTFMYRFKWNGVWGKWIKLNNIGGIITTTSQLPVTALADFDGNSFYTMTDDVLKSLTDCPVGLPDANNPTVITRAIYNDPMTNQSTGLQEIITYKYHLRRRKHSGVWESWAYVKKRCGLLISGDTIENYSEYQNANNVIAQDNAVIGLSAFNVEDVEMKNYPYQSDMLLSRTNGVDGINPTYGSTEIIRTIDEGVTFSRTNWNGIWQEWQADNDYHVNDYICTGRGYLSEASNVLFMGDSLFTVTGGGDSIPYLIGSAVNCAYYNLSVGGARIDLTYAGSTLVKQSEGIADINNKDNIDTVVISIGTNDATGGTPKTQIIPDLTTAFNTIRGLLPALENIYLVSPMPRHNMSRTKVINALILKACKDNDVNFINGNKIPVIPTSYYTDLETETVDGLHYTAKGKKYIAEYIMSKIVPTNGYNVKKIGGHQFKFKNSGTNLLQFFFEHFDRSDYTTYRTASLDLSWDKRARFISYPLPNNTNREISLTIKLDRNNSPDINAVQYLYNRYAFYPVTSNDITLTQSLGTNNKPWETAYLRTSPVITSDETLKTDIQDISEKIKNVAKKIIPKMYKLKGSEKIHFGYIAQDIIKAFESENLNIDDFAVIEKNKDGQMFIRYDELFTLLHSF